MTARLAFAISILSLQSTAQVTFDRLLHANREPQNWLTYSGSPMSQRYSLLTQITPANAKNLELQWVWQARSLKNSKPRRSSWMA
jgi:alcohol dehydrogenase (cytochrome c)